MGDRLGRGRAYTCSRAGTGHAAPAATTAAAAAGRDIGRTPAAAGADRLRHASATMIPTPGIGDAGRPHGPPAPGDADRRARPLGFHDDILLPLCALISAFVLGLLLWVDVPLSAAAPTRRRRATRTTR